MARDQPNSREKMHDFTADFLKCVKFHGKFTEGVYVTQGKFTGPTDVISRCCANANKEISDQRIFTTLLNTKSRLKTVKSHCSTQAIPVLSS